MSNNGKQDNPNDAPPYPPQGVPGTGDETGLQELGDIPPYAGTGENSLAEAAINMPPRTEPQGQTHAHNLSDGQSGAMCKPPAHCSEGAEPSVAHGDAVTISSRPKIATRDKQGSLASSSAPGRSESLSRLGTKLESHSLEDDQGNSDKTDSGTPATSPEPEARDEGYAASMIHGPLTDEQLQQYGLRSR